MCGSIEFELKMKPYYRLDCYSGKVVIHEAMGGKLPNGQLFIIEEDKFDIPWDQHEWYPSKKALMRAEIANHKMYIRRYEKDIREKQRFIKQLEKLSD